MTPLEAALSITGTCTDLLIAAKIRGLLAGYDARWSGSDLVTAAVEDVVESDLWNPATGSKSRSYRVMGKVDWRGTRAGRTVLMDHKTCSEDISDPNAPYWRQLIVEGQLSHYMLLEWLNGRKIDEAVWDVTRKPAISPKKLTIADAKSAVATKRYFAYGLTDDDVLSVSADGRETLAMYSARLAHDCTTERPEHYFQRRTIPRLDAEVLEYAGELWQHGQDMLHTRRNGPPPRNSGACMMYGSPCKFLGICSGHDTPDSDQWRRKEQVHAELPIADGDGRDVLTNSRIRCYQTCRRKHYYDYELGIERQDAEEREALVFGQFWHQALEAFFLQQKEMHGDSYANSSAVIGIATTATDGAEEAFTF